MWSDWVPPSTAAIPWRATRATLFVGLLRGQRDAGGPGRGWRSIHAARLLGAEPILHETRPHAAGGADLAISLEEVVVDVEEEAQPRGEAVDIHAAFHAVVDVGRPSARVKAKLLSRRRSGFTDVIAADGNRVPARHLLGAELDHVADDAHRRTRGHDPGVLGDELLEAVVLDRPADLVARDAALVGQRHVEREEHHRRTVDGHRRGDRLEGQPVEEHLHVAEVSTATPHMPTSPSERGESES